MQGSSLKDFIFINILLIYLGENYYHCEMHSASKLTLEACLKESKTMWQI